MSKTTYVFFEPLNKFFFPAIAEAYSKVLVQKLEDIINDFEKDNPYPTADQIKQSTEEYYKPFPACESLENFICTSAVCGAERKAVITSHQESQLIAAIQKNTAELEKNYEGSNVLINRLKIKYPWYDKKEIITIKERHGPKKHIAVYIDAINKRNRSSKDAKAFVFARAASDSDYPYINAKTKLKPLTPCDDFQKI